MSMSIQYENYFVKSFDWYNIDDKIFIILKYFEHDDMQQFFDTSLSKQKKQYFVHQIVEKLNFMHDKQFAHRDLKSIVNLNCKQTSFLIDWHISIKHFNCWEKIKMMNQDRRFWY